MGKMGGQWEDKIDLANKCTSIDMHSQSCCDFVAESSFEMQNSAFLNAEFIVSNRK